MSIYSARFRAARGYAGLTQKQLGDALGVDEHTIKRRESPGGKEPKKAERIALAQVTGVPLEFIEGGWEALAPLTDVEVTSTTGWTETPQLVRLEPSELRALRELLPQAVELAQELRRGREAIEGLAAGQDLPPTGAGGGGA